MAAEKHMGDQAKKQGKLTIFASYFSGAGKSCAMLKAAQEAKALKAKKAATSTTEAGRVGDRPYARGRSYKGDRYDDQ